MSDDGKTISVRLTPAELSRLQALADESFDGQLSVALRSFLTPLIDDGDEMVFRFSSTGAAYIRDLAARRGGASREGELSTTAEDTVRRAMHLGCRDIENAVAVRGPKRARPPMVIGKQLGKVS